MVGSQDPTPVGEQVAVLFGGLGGRAQPAGQVVAGGESVGVIGPTIAAICCAPSGTSWAKRGQRSAADRRYPKDETVG